MASTLDMLNDEIDAYDSAALGVEPTGLGALNTVQDNSMRKQIFANATQRILQARQAMAQQQPYGGANLPQLAFAQNILKGGAPLANLGNAFADSAKMAEVQRLAQNQHMQDTQGLDLQADMARILGSEGGSSDDNMRDLMGLTTIAGDDKAGSNIARMMLYGARSKSSGGAIMQQAQALVDSGAVPDIATGIMVAKSGVGPGRTLRDGQVENITGYEDAKEREKYSERIGARNAEIDTAKALKTEEKTAEAMVEKKSKFPKATAALRANQDNSLILNDNINKALPNINMWTSGFLGKKAEWAGLPQAVDLAARLNTIKTNAGFDALQEMRDNSPTGGALGSVSDYENKNLQAKWYSLENSQSPEQLKENLIAFQEAVKRKDRRIQEAYEQDYQDFLAGKGEEPNAPEYDTPDAIKAAYKAGKLDKQKAKELLKAHGFN